MRSHLMPFFKRRNFLAGKGKKEKTDQYAPRINTKFSCNTYINYPLLINILISVSLIF